MFLGMLSPRCKENFLDLAIHLVMADNVLRREEKNILAGYCGEMGLDYFQNRKPMELDTLIRSFDEESWQVKKIVFFELISLALSDKDYAPEEKALIKRIKAGFSITDEIEKVMEETIIKIFDLYTKTNDIIMNE